MPGQVQQLHDVIKEVESFSSAQSRSQTWYKPSPPVGIPLYPPPAYPKTPSENSSFTDEELNVRLYDRLFDNNDSNARSVMSLQKRLQSCRRAD